MTNHQPPLDPETAALRGLPPARRAELITGAKASAMRFTWAVKTRSAAEAQRVTAGWGRDEWAALAVVLAEGVKPGDMRLALVARVADDEERRGAA